MPWFKVDDGLHAHMKAVRAGVPAMGLWVLAGSWSSNQLTDGWVPDYIVSRLDPDFREHAATLVRAGLWVEDELDGDKGWRFHQWEEHQPSSESVLAKREAARERMRRVRGQRAAGSREHAANVREQDKGSAGRVSHEKDSAPSHEKDNSGRPARIDRFDTESRGGSRHVRANTAGNFAGSAPNPDPTRPDLLPTEVKSTASAAKPRGVSDDDPSFASFWDAYPRKDDKGHARKAWGNALKRATAEQVIAGAQQFAATCARTNTERRFIPLPTTWLNGERWSDQPIAAVANGNRYQPYRDPEDPATAYTQGL
ncbi:hypothetical protein AB0I37_25040 [Micromonospora purpureochromogenes]|uniref:hypothetical protein n=1 Tax=Micromonospora purpureochromogenes TaxID=47872 RepID=UPI0033C995F3